MNPIKRVRIAFVAIAEISVLVFLFAILLVTNLITRSQVAQAADDRISYIASYPNIFLYDPNSPWPFASSTEVPSEEQPIVTNVPPEGSGAKGENPFENPNWGGWGVNPWGDYMGPTPSEDQTAGTRFFTVTKRNDGQYFYYLNNISAYDEEKAKETAEYVWSLGKTGGYVDKTLRYKTYEVDVGKFIIFVDWSSQLEPVNNFLIASLIIASSGAAIVFIVLIFISRLVVKPMVVANEKQKRFISDASHELKTPLTIISANNEIIEMMHGKDETTDTIEKQVTKMTEMVRSMTFLSKLGEEERTAFSKLNFSDICLSVVEEFKAPFQKEGKELTTSIKEDIFVKGSETHLRKLLSIFLDNARKYALSRCEVSLKDDWGVVLRVSNDIENGEPGSYNKVFDRFYRSDEARGSHEEGSGIGLSIAKQIAEIHKASIHCDITPEKEFVMTVEF